MGREQKEIISGVRIRGTAIQIDFYYNNIRCRETLKLEPSPKNIKYAIRLKATIELEIEQNKFDYKRHFPNSKRAKMFIPISTTITCADLLLTQLAIYKRRYDVGNMAKSTYDGYKQIIKNKLIPDLGEYKLYEVTPKILRQWVLMQELSSKTFYNKLTPLRSILQEAVHSGYISINPFDNAGIESLITDISLPKKQEIDPFNEEEKNIIINHATGQLKNLVQFAFYSGLRTGELIALRWSDIDFSAGVVNVTNNIVEGQEKAPKTIAGIRKVLLLPKATEALLEQQKITEIENNFVFHNPNTNKRWLDSEKIRYHWKKLLKSAGVRYRYPYQTRHSYASMLLSNGELPAWIASQLGHANVQMVYNVYAKWIPDSSLKDGYKLKGVYE